MDHRTELIRLIDKFNVESVEEFKEAENKIVLDSRFRTIMRKKDYAGHMETLRSVKKKAQRLDPSMVDIPEDDIQAKEIEKAFEKCLFTFSNVCDSYIRMQQALKDKVDKVQDISFGDYKDISNRTKELRARLNAEMHDMDILYSDIIEYIDDDKNEDFGGVQYRTYDSFQD